MGEVQGELFGGEGEEPLAKPKHTHKLTEEQRDRLCREYISGEEIANLAARYGILHHSVWLLLKRRGIPRRPRAEWTRRHYPLREDAFADAASDPAASYWAGMLMADGSIASRGDGSYNLALSLAMEDREHVDAFRKFLGAENHKIVTDNSHLSDTRFPNSQPSARFALSSPQLIADLARYGVVPNKTLRTHVKFLEGSPDFWRGCVDGDGWLGMHSNTHAKVPVIGLSGSRSLMEQFSAFARSAVPGVPARVLKHLSIWKVKVTGQHGQRLIDTLYSRNGPSLARKLAIAKELLEWQCRKGRDWTWLTLAHLDALRTEHPSWRAVANFLGIRDAQLHAIRARLKLNPR